MSATPTTGSVPEIPPTASAPEPAAAGWTVRTAILFTLVVVGGAYALGFAIAYAVVGVRFGIGAVLDPSLPLWQGGAAVRFSAATLLGIELIQLGLAFALAGWSGRDRTTALQLAWPRLGILQWVGFLLLLFIVKMVATMVVAAFSPTSARDDLQPFQELFGEPLTRALFLATVVLAGLTEEIIFRGVLSRTLEESRLGFWGGALLANAVFASVHMQYGLGGQLVVFAIGMSLSWMRAASGSIWPGALCHAANNAVAFAAMRAMS